MALNQRCPKCRSTNITGRGFDMGDGDELQERYCFDCKYGEERMRSAGGVSWYAVAPPQEPHRLHAATGLERTLVDEIYAAPDDDTPRSIYADWLIEQGDPLGTFIALQLARARTRDVVISAEERALVDRHWSAWIGNPSAVVDKRDVELERGFWSACDRFQPSAHDIEQEPDIIGSRSWSTVRRLTLTSRRALALLERFDPPLAIEELVIAFDVSRDPPALAFPHAPRLRTIGVHCLGELGERWIERAVAAGFANLRLVTRPQGAETRAMVKRAHELQLATLSIEVAPTKRRPGATFIAERVDGVLLVRRIDLHGELFSELPRWIDELEGWVDRGLKVTLPTITAALAEKADALGLRLVAHPTSFAAKPR